MAVNWSFNTWEGGQSKLRLGCFIKLCRENAVTTSIAHLLAFVAMSHSPQKFTGRLPFDEASLRWIADGSNLAARSR